MLSTHGWSCICVSPVLSNIMDKKREVQREQMNILKPKTKPRRGKVANSQVVLWKLFWSRFPVSQGWPKYRITCFPELPNYPQLRFPDCHQLLLCPVPCCWDTLTDLRPFCLLSNPTKKRQGQTYSQEGREGGQRLQRASKHDRQRFPKGNKVSHLEDLQRGLCKNVTWEEEMKPPKIMLLSWSWGCCSVVEHLPSMG